MAERELTGVPLTHGGAGTRIATQVRDAILSGAYSPGDRIRQEDLADEHGASRVPVRDALRILEAEGLVTRVANAGAWVTRLSLGQYQEIYQIRERLEPLLLQLNVEALSKDALDELDRLAHAMEAASSAEEFLTLDRTFHFITFSSTPTLMLHQTATRLWNLTNHYRRAYVVQSQQSGTADAHHDHHLLVSALRRRDADEAARTLELHIRRTRLELARHPEIFDH